MSFIKDTIDIIVFSRNLDLKDVLLCSEYDIEVDYIDNPTSQFIIGTFAIDKIEIDDFIIVKSGTKYIYYGKITSKEKSEGRILATYFHSVFNENIIKNGTAEGQKISFTNKYTDTLYNLLNEAYINIPTNPFASYEIYHVNNDDTRYIQNINLINNQAVDDFVVTEIVDEDSSAEQLNLLDDFIHKYFIDANVVLTPQYDATNKQFNITVNEIKEDNIIITDKTADIINFDISEGEKVQKTNTAFIYYDNYLDVNSEYQVYYATEDESVTQDKNAVNRVKQTHTAYIKVDYDDYINNAEEIAKSNILGSDKNHRITLELKIYNKTYNNDGSINFDYFKLGRKAIVYYLDRTYNTILSGYGFSSGNEYITLKFGKKK